MKNCQRCQSTRVASVTGKVSDCCSIELDNFEHQGYVPDGLGIGEGDYLEFSYCLDCGQLQEKFPLKHSKFDKELSDEEIRVIVENSFTPGEYFNYSRAHARDLVNDTSSYSMRFSAFLKDFLEVNMLGGIKKFPTVEKFIEMYRKQTPEIED